MNVNWLPNPNNRIAWKKGPLITPDANCVSQVYWRNSALVDAKGLSWSMQGTVPQVAASGKIPPGAGPYTSGKYYSLGAGADALDFTGDFTATLVFKPSSVDSTQRILFVNGQDSDSGYYVDVYTGGVVRAVFNRAGANAPVVPVNAQIANVVNVFCFGRSGTTGYAKLNGGALVTQNTTAIVAGATSTAYVGRYSQFDILYADNTVMLEMEFRSTTPTDDLFTSIMNAVKSKCGITAW